MSVVALLGHQNVGKSALFQRLTGRYVTVANYPGTTVEIARGAAHSLPGVEIVDTPGLVSLPSRTEDEQVAARLLLQEEIRAAVQVGDAKNLRRTLLLTVQLAEMGVPLVLALNMMDEASARGLTPDHERLSELLGLPVVPTVATRGVGMTDLEEAIRTAAPSRLMMHYPVEIEAAVEAMAEWLPACGVSPRALGLLWLSGDPAAAEWLREHTDEERFRDLIVRRNALAGSFSEPLSTVILRTRQAHVDRLTSGSAPPLSTAGGGLAARIGRVAVHPLWGLALLAAVLYGFYWFVGVIGAGVLVGLLEERLFGEIVNPALAGLVERLVPFALLRELVVGEYGLWTMGITYAFALILPIVLTFFASFAVLEDSGYLPRLAVLSNRLFRLMGLNGKAVLPMVLGLGCVTMATMTTRIMESRRDRALVILLLALAVPCSAQLGVVMGMLAGISLGATLIWAGVVLGVLLLVGLLAARLMPGERLTLLIELPPMRMPMLSSVVVKTLARLEWYLKEVVPIFLAGTALLFAMQRVGVLPWLVRSLEPLVGGWLGLPPQAAEAFLMGFLRRDFGATGLFAMGAAGQLSPLQVVVAMVTITLFIPCIAAVMMIARERGSRTAATVVAVVFPLAFLVGGLLFRLLAAIGWGG